MSNKSKEYKPPRRLIRLEILLSDQYKPGWWHGGNVWVVGAMRLIFVLKVGADD